MNPGGSRDYIQEDKLMNKTELIAAVAEQAELSKNCLLYTSDAADD